MKDYKDLKAKGLVALVVTDSGVIVQRSKWNPDTGEPITPELTAVDEKVLAAEKVTLQTDVTAQVADIDALLADADKAKKAKKAK